MTLDVSIQQVKALVRLLHENHALARVSLYISGPPGIGKTALFAQLAAELGWHHRVYPCATFDPTDVVGIPAPVNEMTVFLPPARFHRLTAARQERRPTIAVFDDLPTCSDQVFAALHRMFHERYVEDERIRDNVLLCATGNRVEDNSGAKNLPAALSNRLVHLNLKVTLDEWVTWAMQNDIDPMLIAFHRSTQGRWLHDFKPAEAAFPTPRSNVTASLLYRTVPDPEMLRAVLAGSCGEGWAQAFLTFARLKEQLVPTEEIFKNPHTARIPTDIDVLYTVMANLATALANELRRPANPFVGDETEMVRAILCYAMRFTERDMAVKVINDTLRLVVSRPDVYEACAGVLEEVDKRFGHLSGL